MKSMIAGLLLMSSWVYAAGIEVHTGSSSKSAHSVQAPGQKLKIPIAEQATATGKDFGDFAPVQSGTGYVIRAWLLPTGLEKLQKATNDTRDDVFDNRNLPNDVQAAKQHDLHEDERWVCLIIDGETKDCRPMSKLADDLKVDAKNQPQLIRRGFEITGFKKMDDAMKYAKKLFDTRAAEFKPMKPAPKVSKPKGR